MDNDNLILQTDQHGKLKGLPSFPPNRQVEAIFRIIEKVETKKAVRYPSPDIAGKIQIKGDIIDSVDMNKWDLSDDHS